MAGGRPVKVVEVWAASAAAVEVVRIIVKVVHPWTMMVAVEVAVVGVWSSRRRGRRIRRNIINDNRANVIFTGGRKGLGPGCLI